MVANITNDFINRFVFIYVGMNIFAIVTLSEISALAGAAVSVFTLLYSQLGLPAEALSLMIAINAVLQFLTVGVDVWCMQSEIVCLSRSGRLTEAKAS